jgi:GDP-D-mannose 3',5'-epimerase
MGFQLCCRYGWNGIHPKQPQDACGLEKLVTEELAMLYQTDFGMQTRIARFHNIYGPWGTWRGGREKAPAAFCRKTITATKEIEIWGDGLQTRSFTFIDDCIEGVWKLFNSDYAKPLNIGSDEMVSMNELAGIGLALARNTLIKKVLGWATHIALRDGLAKTYALIKEQVDACAAKGEDITKYSTSTVVHLTDIPELGAHRQK